MTQLSTQAAPQPASDQRRQRRAESLFTRITGFGLVRPSSQHEEEHQEAPPTEETTQGQQHLGVDPSYRPALSAEQPEDLLEIPAFLRRQSNH
jgi:hypothetical protein